jgi:hypothetical protein
LTVEHKKGDYMKNSINKVAFVALIALALVFVACSNPAGSGAAGSIVEGNDPDLGQKIIKIINMPSNALESNTRIVIHSEDPSVYPDIVGFTDDSGNFIIPLEINSSPREPWCGYGEYLVAIYIEYVFAAPPQKYITFHDKYTVIDFAALP